MHVGTILQIMYLKELNIFKGLIFASDIFSICVTFSSVNYLTMLWLWIM